MREFYTETQQFVEPLNGTEYTRREFIRRALGYTLTAASCGLATACGSNEFSGSESIPSVNTLGEINEAATVSQQARRGTQIQIGPKPGIPKLWNPGDLIFGGDRNGPAIVAFTFDDGPWPINTQGVMNHFRDKGLESIAHLAWVARNAQNFPDIAREAVQRGYGIINHSLTHSTYNPSAIANEIIPAQDLIQSVSGVRPEFFRSPGLTEGDIIQQVLAGQGMCNIFTTTNLNDWVSPRVSTEQLIQNLNNTIHPGNIILLHDGGSHTQTVNAVPYMIDVARSKGYEIVRLEELLANGHLQGKYGQIQSTNQEVVQSINELDLELPQTDIDWIAEMQTVLEEAINLTPDQRLIIENEIKALSSQK